MEIGLFFSLMTVQFSHDELIVLDGESSFVEAWSLESLRLFFTCSVQGSFQIGDLWRSTTKKKLCKKLYYLYYIQGKEAKNFWTWQT